MKQQPRLTIEYRDPKALKPHPKNARAHLEGQIAVDFFHGSGSMLVAAEQLKRIAYAIELDPVYVDVAVRRWQDLTGKEATHATEKQTFNAVTKARAVKEVKAKAKA